MDDKLANRLFAKDMFMKLDWKRIVLSSLTSRVGASLRVQKPTIEGLRLCLLRFEGEAGLVLLDTEIT